MEPPTSTLPRQTGDAVTSESDTGFALYNCKVPVFSSDERFTSVVNNCWIRPFCITNPEAESNKVDIPAGDVKMINERLGYVNFRTKKMSLKAFDKAGVSFIKYTDWYVVVSVGHFFVMNLASRN
jgi:hypothetical protein